MISKLLMALGVGAVAFLLFLGGCRTGEVRNETPAQTPEVSESESPAPDPSPDEKERFRTSIDGIGGVVTLSKYFDEKDKVRIYERNGRVWYQFTYLDEAFEELEGLNTDFLPLAFHPDYFLLVMRAVAEDDKTYEVVVNEGESSQICGTSFRDAIRLALSGSPAPAPTASSAAPISCSTSAYGSISRPWLLACSWC